MSPNFTFVVNDIIGTRICIIISLYFIVVIITNISRHHLFYLVLAIVRAYILKGFARERISWIFIASLRVIVQSLYFVKILLAENNARHADETNVRVIWLRDNIVGLRLLLCNSERGHKRTSKARNRHE